MLKNVGAGVGARLAFAEDPSVGVEVIEKFPAASTACG